MEGLHMADSRNTTVAPALSARSPSVAMVTEAILEAIGEAFPKARQRRRVALALAETADRFAGRANVLVLDEAEPRARAEARTVAAEALREALGSLPTAFDRSPMATLAESGVRPLRAPRTGAEAVLYISDAETARIRLVAVLARLSTMHERLLDVVADVTNQLDLIDGDPDLEEGCDDDAACEDEGFDCDGEPWLAAPEGAQNFNDRRRCGVMDEREEACEDEGGACEDEGAQCEGEGDQVESDCGLCCWPDGDVDQTKFWLRAPLTTPAFL